MRLSTAIEVPGEIEVFAPNVPPPAEGIAIRYDGYAGRPGSVWVNGVRVGLLMRHPQVDGEPVFSPGSPEPIDYLAHATTLHVYLVLPTPTDDEFEAAFADFPSPR